MKRISLVLLLITLLIFGCSPKKTLKIIEVDELIVEEAEEVINETIVEEIKEEIENKYVICIDPGHQRVGNYELEPIAPGSHIKKPKVSDGAIGISTSKEEYELTLEVSLKLKDELERSGYEVILTRQTHDVNISNAERAKMANQNEADLFIRIHADQSGSEIYNGISILCPSELNTYTAAIYEKSNQLANLLLKAMLSTTEADDMGISYRDDISGFNWSEVPVILVELGFMSNPEEDEKLNTKIYQDKLVDGMLNGINNYFILED